jgi:penicillin-binding protein 1A
MATLTPPVVIEYARRFGLTTPLPPYLPIAIGAGDDTLLEMTSAYTAWPNQGVRMAPLPVLEIVDRDGNSLEVHRPEPHEAIRADTAFIMTDMLQGVIREGTARSAAGLGWPLGGKTGTTDEATDTWFIGFDPDITLGVWVGFDQKKSLGSSAQGAVIALPIWEDIMKSWIARRRAELPEPPTFARPGNIVEVATDHGREVYIAGTEPAAQPDVPAN